MCIEGRNIQNSVYFLHWVILMFFYMYSGYRKINLSLNTSTTLMANLINIVNTIFVVVFFGGGLCPVYFCRLVMMMMTVKIPLQNKIKCMS